MKLSSLSFCLIFAFVGCAFQQEKNTISTESTVSEKIEWHPKLEFREEEKAMYNFLGFELPNTPITADGQILFTHHRDLSFAGIEKHKFYQIRKDTAAIVLEMVHLENLIEGVDTSISHKSCNSLTTHCNMLYIQETVNRALEKEDWQALETLLDKTDFFDLEWDREPCWVLDGEYNLTVFNSKERIHYFYGQDCEEGRNLVEIAIFLEQL